MRKAERTGILARAAATGLGLTGVAGFLAAAVGLGACFEASSPVAGGASSETVIGRVLLPGGEPAAGVSYTLRDMRHLRDPKDRLPSKIAASAGPKSGRTDSQGRYRIDSVPPGEYLLEFEGAAFGALLLPVDVDGRVGTVSLEDDSLREAGSLTGRLVPAADTSVRDSALRSAYVQLFGVDRAVSVDSAGRFRILGLAPGRYRLRAAAAFPFLQGAELAGVEVASGDTSDIGDLALIRISAASFTPLVPDGLIAYWPCDEGAGDLTVDPVGANDGVLSGGPSWAAGIRGKALVLDGVDDQVAVPQMYLPGDFTVAAWVRLEGALDNSQVLLGQNDSMNLNFAVARLHFYTGEKIPPGGPGRPGDPLDAVVAQTRMVAGVWTHVALVRRAGVLTVHMGGAADGTGDWPGTVLFNRIGTGVQINADVRRQTFLKAKIDEIRVYDRALTPGELSELAASG